jgi:hypothetical protein
MRFFQSVISAVIFGKKLREKIVFGIFDKACFATYLHFSYQSYKNADNWGFEAYERITGIVKHVIKIVD